VHPGRLKQFFTIFFSRPCFFWHTSTHSKCPSSFRYNASRSSFRREQPLDEFGHRTFSNGRYKRIFVKAGDTQMSARVKELAISSSFSWLSHESVRGEFRKGNRN